MRDAVHYLTGYDPKSGAVRREHPVPQRAVAAIRDLVGFELGATSTRKIEPDLVPIAGFAVDVVIPLHECDNLDWYVDTYSRREES